jgi:hypothetical protein
MTGIEPVGVKLAEPVFLKIRIYKFLGIERGLCSGGYTLPSKPAQ